MSECGCNRFASYGRCYHTDPEFGRAVVPSEASRPVQAERDRDWEQRFLAYVDSLADHFGAADPTITERVLKRVNGTGVRNYADARFLSADDDRDLLAELRDEASDLIAYAMFAIERRRVVDGDESEDGEVWSHLSQAAAHAAVADYHASQAQRLAR